MIKILIADDHPIVRRGLKQIVAETSDMVVADEAINAKEVLSKVREKHYDVILLDITMPGMNGLDILKDLRYLTPKTPILMLSIHPEEQYAIRALKDGASGYLTKESAPEELISAVRKVSQGGKYITPSLAERLASDLEKGVDEPLHYLLSNREFAVMCMIASGKTIGQIANQMLLSKNTISTYRSRILTKLKLKNNIELTSYALRNKLID